MRRNAFGAGLGAAWAASHAEGLCFLGGSWRKRARGGEWDPGAAGSRVLCPQACLRTSEPQGPGLENGDKSQELL